MSTVLILVMCSAAAEPVCVEHAFEMPGWSQCIDSLQQHGLRAPGDAPGGKVTMTACALGEPGTRRLPAG